MHNISESIKETAERGNMGALSKVTLYFMLVQLVFLASGYIIHAMRGRLLGPAACGIFGVVISLMTLVNVLLITGVPMAGSRFIAMANESVRAIKRAAVNLQVILSLAVFALYFLLSQVIAGMAGGASLIEMHTPRACGTERRRHARTE